MKKVVVYKEMSEDSTLGDPLLLDDKNITDFTDKSFDEINPVLKERKLSSVGYAFNQENNLG
jgi:hypothetical protein